MNYCNCIDLQFSYFLRWRNNSFMCHLLDLSTAFGSADPISSSVGRSALQYALKLLSQMHTSQLLAKIKCIIFSYHFIIWYILTLKILYEMDLGDMGRSNHFLHPLHSSTQKCSVSSYCGHIMTACQDVISGHKTTLCAFIFFLGGLWICHASTDPLMIATIPALDCSMLCSLWRTPEISAWRTVQKGEGLYLGLLLSLLVSYFPIDCHSLSKKK